MLTFLLEYHHSHNAMLLYFTPMLHHNRNLCIIIAPLFPSFLLFNDYKSSAGAALPQHAMYNWKNNDNCNNDRVDLMQNEILKPRHPSVARIN